ncbi:low molecular weight protein-tyrosine-phosphatase [Inhella gelatinilytica]|uniref:protein-tyrosine-phosphatase n=1 Tax=Inhella gelatinilytica TaxID=2795030 RepID=A0A931N9J1_9BURK|nr:low molecular weight protein-tyrosine-phosphatase [Inhella gelatinilytica]MBH9551418.1 low molecular weight phosphotyrosine protein phosphatase [Inhella gelatinilytica]
MTPTAPIRVLFVCMGNICRSPTAHGVMRAKVQAAGLAHRIEVDSAGTHAYHVGEPPDERTQAHARRRGYDISDLRARALVAEDFERFDRVLVMDGANLARAAALCPPARRPRLDRLLAHAPALRTPDVPDPYYGGSEGFETVLDLVEAACDALLANIQRELDS